MSVCATQSDPCWAIQTNGKTAHQARAGFSISNANVTGRQHLIDFLMSAFGIMRSLVPKMYY